MRALIGFGVLEGLVCFFEFSGQGRRGWPDMPESRSLSFI